jgi:oligopeptide/dipeptide ABC transporter ATP-binding protein
MYLGKLVKVPEAKELYRNPRHPYTRALLSAVPVPDPEVKKQRMLLSGDIPTPINPPAGCRFHTRCPEVIDVCRTVEPPMAVKNGCEGHLGACHVTS